MFCYTYIYSLYTFTFMLSASEVLMTVLMWLQNQPTISAVKCPPTDLYQSLTNHCQRLWQVEWDGCVSNKLHSVKPTLGYLNLSHLSRRDDVTLRRLQIGHTEFSHSYLLNWDEQPRCTFWDCALTVVHMLLKCPHYSIVRQRYFSVTTLKERLEILCW